MRTRNQLNNPLNNNKEYVKKNLKGSEHTTASKLNDNNSRYHYEFGNQADFSAKDSPLARGANIANAFSYPLAGSAEEASVSGNFGKHNEEYALEQSDNSALQREVNERKIKSRFQENLRQNYNVEFSKDDLINNEDSK